MGDVRLGCGVVEGVGFGVDDGDDGMSQPRSRPPIV